MLADRRWSRGLLIAGTIAMVFGAVDPMEGSVVIFVGTALAALGTSLSHSRHAPMLLWAFALVFFGVGSLWVFSFFGGVGGPGGPTKWWLLLVAPYPVGWLLGLVSAVRELREKPMVRAA